MTSRFFGIKENYLKIRISNCEIPSSELEKDAFLYAQLKRKQGTLQFLIDLQKPEFREQLKVLSSPPKGIPLNVWQTFYFRFGESDAAELKRQIVQDGKQFTLKGDSLGETHESNCTLKLSIENPTVGVDQYADDSKGSWFSARDWYNGTVNGIAEQYRNDFR